MWSQPHCPSLFTFQSALRNTNISALPQSAGTKCVFMCQVPHKHMDVRDFCLKEHRGMVIHTFGTGGNWGAEFVHHPETQNNCKDTVNIPLHPTAKGAGSHQLSTLWGLQLIKGFTLFNTKYTCKKRVRTPVCVRSHCLSIPWAAEVVARIIHHHFKQIGKKLVHVSNVLKIKLCNKKTQELRLRARNWGWERKPGQHWSNFWGKICRT